MKKLMIAAAATVIAGGAFAQPQIYEYKAALKNMNLKEVKVTIDKVPYTVYMKYSTSTSLKGWLIMDQDGYTSPTIMNDMLGGLYGSASTGFDYGRNRGFLVVINPKAYKAVRRPKILPAILDAKWLDTAFTKGGNALTGPAEGYLYVGGDAVKPVRPQIDYLYSLVDSNPDRAQRNITNEVPVIGARVPYVPAVAALAAADTTNAGGDGAAAGNADDPAAGNAQPTTTTASSVVATNYSGMVAIADYVWTSVYLFAGSTEKDAYFNGPNWFKIGSGVNAHSPFGMFEFAWDQNLPPFLQTGWMTNTLTTANRPRAAQPANPWVNYYHDTWMNGSGVAGKWSRNKEDGEQCCGIISTDTVDRPILETLSGNVKGGLFLCTENGINAKDTAYNWLLGVQWEDQFITARLNKSDLFRADSWQNDLWQDGFFEIETTDVITGTWIIKRATGKFFAKKNQIAVALTPAEEATLLASTSAQVPSSISKTVTQQATAEDPDNPDADPKPVYIGPDGQETFDAQTTDADTGAVTANTPKMIDVVVNSSDMDVVWDELLWMAIKGAALNLANKNGGQVTLFNGTEIYTKTSSERANIPMVTPQFALYYRLVFGVYKFQE